MEYGQRQTSAVLHLRKERPAPTTARLFSNTSCAKRRPLLTFRSAWPQQSCACNPVVRFQASLSCRRSCLCPHKSVHA